MRWASITAYCSIPPFLTLTEFLEAKTIYPLDNGVGVYAKHKHRPWDNRHSFRIARGGVAGMRHVQSATAIGTFMRILDNCTHAKYHLQLYWHSTHQSIEITYMIYPVQIQLLGSFPDHLMKSYHACITSDKNPSIRSDACMTADYARGQPASAWPLAGQPS